jgi:hypothetical protein
MRLAQIYLRMTLPYVPGRCPRDFGDVGDFLPHHLFFNFCFKQKHFRKSTLGPPLRDAWVALGPRLGHPRVTQAQSQSGRGSWGG